jgi:hypothetical protein
MDLFKQIVKWLEDKKIGSVAKNLASSQNQETFTIRKVNQFH